MASGCPAAFRTGAAAALAALSLTGEPLPPGAGFPPEQTAPFWQLSVPPEPYRAKLQVPGACLFTRRAGPEPSPSDPTFQYVASACGVPARPSAFASRATSAAETVPTDCRTAAVRGPSGSLPDAR